MEVAASPLPIFSLFGGPAKAPTVEVLMLEHNTLMTKGNEIMHQVTGDKLKEYYQASLIRQKGYPVMHSTPIHEPGVYSNRWYVHAIHKTKGNEARLAWKAAKMRTHIDALANHPQQEDVKKMLKGATRTHEGLKTAKSYLHDHVEDPGAHEEIKRLREAKALVRGKGHDSLPRGPLDEKDIALKANHVMDTYESLPSQYRDELWTH
jgi:hypothetical protein